MAKRKAEINTKQGVRLRQLCKWEDISQAKLSEKIGVTPNTLSRVAAGRAAMSYTTAQLIHEHYRNYSVDWLLGKVDYPAEGLKGIHEASIRETKRQLLYQHISQLVTLTTGCRVVEVGEVPHDKGLYVNEDLYYMLLSRGHYEVIDGEGNSVSFSLAEINAFLFEIGDFIEFKLKKLISEKKEASTNG